MIKCKLAIEDGLDCQKCCLNCDEQTICEDVCGSIKKHNQYIVEHGCEFQQVDEEQQVEEETELQTINKAIPDVLKAITHITVAKKRLDDQEKLMKKKLLEAMEQFGIKKFENDQVVFTYVAPTTRTSIDSDRLKKDLPQVAKEYSKTSNVSASVRIKVK